MRFVAVLLFALLSVSALYSNDFQQKMNENVILAKGKPKPLPKPKDTMEDSSMAMSSPSVVSSAPAPVPKAKPMPKAKPAPKATSDESSGNVDGRLKHASHRHRGYQRMREGKETPAPKEPKEKVTGGKGKDTSGQDRLLAKGKDSMTMGSSSMSEMEPVPKPKPTPKPKPVPKPKDSMTVGSSSEEEPMPKPKPAPKPKSVLKHLKEEGKAKPLPKEKVTNGKEKDTSSSNPGLLAKPKDSMTVGSSSDTMSVGSSSEPMPKPKPKPTPKPKPVPKAKPVPKEPKMKPVPKPKPVPTVEESSAPSIADSREAIVDDLKAAHPLKGMFNNMNQKEE